MSLKEEENHLINNEEDALKFLETLSSNPVIINGGNDGAEDPNLNAFSIFETAPPPPAASFPDETNSGVPAVENASSVPVPSEATPFQMQEIEEDGAVSTYEQAVRKIVILEDRLKRKDGELAETQKQIESALSENGDALESLEKAEALSRRYEGELAEAQNSILHYRAELDKADKTIRHEHEKRRLHLLHVRDLKHAIAERDARIKQIESGADVLRYEPGAPADAPAEIKKLQSEIFYKEIEIEKINAQLLSAQGETLSLKSQNDDLKSDIESLKLEIVYRNNSIAELNGEVFSLESELKGLSVKYAALAQLNISAEDIEKLRLASEMKEFLEDELDKMPAVEDADEAEESKVSEEAEGEAEAAEGGQRQLSEFDEIKEKFKSLMAERDKAIELLDKFEVESKLKERELNELKTKHSAMVLDKETVETSLKEKEIELQGIYNAFSSYKEESGFMSRENKELKEEREALNTDIAKLRQLMVKFEQTISDKDGEIVRLLSENEEKLKAAAEEYETKARALNEEKDEAVQQMKTACDTETVACRAESEKCGADLEAFKGEFAAFEAKYQSALADYQGLKLNVEGLLENITETLERDLDCVRDEAAAAGARVENELAVISCLSGEATDEIISSFERFAANCELKITKTEYAAAEGAEEAARPFLCVLVIEGEKELLKAIELKRNIAAPFLLYSKNRVAVQKITELVSRGVIDDYLDSETGAELIDTVMTRAVEERLARLRKVNIKKDGDEIKLRESVALTIDNKVKSGRIEALNERIEYLKDANRRMRANINEMQGLFDQIISRITALSLQEIPQNISEGFNEITAILLKITSIKL
jgi:chromosome segregation ATPase